MLCCAAAEVVAKAAGPGGAERAVQLLHRISPCPPFFHMEEDVLRHTLHVGFSPSGILRPAAGPAAPGSDTGGTRRHRPARLGPSPSPPAADVAAWRRGGRSAAGPCPLLRAGPPLRTAAGGRNGTARENERMGGGLFRMRSGLKLCQRLDIRKHRKRC